MALKMEYKREITIISGLRDAGKTKLCLNLVQKLTSTGKTIKGIVSPGLYKDNKKIGIIVRDVASGEECEFAKYSPGWDINRPEREWRFLSSGVTWANSRIKNAVPTDILFIDEIGYLEMEEKGGWTAALENLDKGMFDHAILVIRPDLLEKAQERWNIRRIIMVRPEDDLEDLSNQLISYLVDRA